ncbi:MAG: methyltransferase domain-containing protein [Dehalococcoidia bacterium]|nr:methyltransferase domain-containing protein [Dehalococcoidia bacterium]
MANPLTPTAEEALAEWARRVDANRDQAEAYREQPAGPDFYAPAAQSFKADPHRTDEPLLDALRVLVQPGETWLDIGAGAGRYALALAVRAKELIAVDPSPGMLQALREQMADYGIANIRVVNALWPPEEPLGADVAMFSHVSYDIAAIGPFLDAMERSARRLCVAVLLARGRLCEVRLFARQPMTHTHAEGPLRWLRQQLFIAEGSEKDQKLVEAVQTMVTERDGVFAMNWDDLPVGIVTWRPPHA